MGEGSMRKKIWLHVVSCVVLANLLISCSEGITNPLTPGSGLFQNDVVILSDTLHAISSTTFRQRIAPDNRFFSPIPMNFVGTDSNITAYALVRWVPPSRDTITVLSATVTLRFLSWRGNATGTFGFTAHKVNTAWSQLSVTWDTVQTTNFFESTLERGRYEGTLQSDTLVVTFSLDTALVRQWHRSDIATYGILLKPTSSTTRLLRGFQAFIDGDTSVKFQPELKVIARNATGTVIDTAKYAAGLDTYVANASSFDVLPDHVYSHGGIAYRSVLKFDLGNIPRGAVINSAELQLDLDPALSKLSRFTSLQKPSVHALTGTDSTLFETIVALGSIKTGTTYAFDIRHQVQLWVGGRNYGLLLRQADDNEFGGLDLFAFFNQNAANPALRPRIHVKYTLFQ